MNNYSKADIVKLFQHKNLPAPENVDSFDAMFPLVGLLKAENSVFIFKMDGERREEKEEKIYTAIISTTGRPSKVFRADSNDLFGAIRHAFIEYAKEYWSFSV